MVEWKSREKKTIAGISNWMVSIITRRFALAMSVDEVPVATLEIPYLDGEMSVDAEINHDVKLYIAAKVVRDELLKKGDWYKALVASIHGYLREKDGSVLYEQMAVELANQIVGIEPDRDDIDNLDLSVRAYNCLKRVGVKTVSQLRLMSADELANVRNLNQRCIDEVAEKMEEYYG